MLDKLPEDILVLIWRRIRNQSNRFNFLRVSRRTYQACLVYLYRDVVLRGFSIRRKRSRIIPFVQALVRKPHLSQIVLSLVLSWELNVSAHGEHEQEHEERQGLDIIDLDLVEDLTNKVGSLFEDEFPYKTALILGDEDAWVGLLIFLLPGLKRLTLYLPYSYDETGYFYQLLQRATSKKDALIGIPSPFPSLEAVEVRLDDDRGWCSSYLITPFLYCQSIKSLFAENLREAFVPVAENANSERSEITIPRQNPSSLTHLRLLSSTGCNGLKDIIKACDSTLTCFKYQHESIPGDDNAHFDGSRFYQSLLGTQKTLQTLYLSYLPSHQIYVTRDWSKPEQAWLGSFAEFNQLKQLRLKLCNLLDYSLAEQDKQSLVDILPRSLESLHIEDCDEEYLPTLLKQLYDVVIPAQSRFGHLRRVDLQATSTQFEQEEGEDEGVGNPISIWKLMDLHVQPVKLACKSSGIELNLCDAEFSKTMEVLKQISF